MNSNTVNGQQLSEMELQNFYRNAAAQAQQRAQSADNSLANIYSSYVRPQHQQASQASYPTTTSDEAPQEDNMGAMDQGNSGTVPLANGSVLVTKPTIAVLGEQGPERVLPLNSNPYNKTNSAVGVGRYRGGQ